MKSEEIEKMLADRHAGEIFVPQCKIGASHSQGLFILDGWAMNKSWANLKFTGYEIKVSRSDFIHDNKWRGYLDYCNEFYFVCPQGVVDKSEISEEAGLLLASKTGSRLFIKKKAPFRKIKPPAELLIYILMCRAEIQYSEFSRKREYAEGKLDFWKEWLAGKKEDKQFAGMVSRKISEKYTKDVLEARKQIAEVLEANEALKEMKEFCKTLGVNPLSYDPVGEFKKKMELVNKGIPDGLKYDLENAIERLQDVQEVFFGKEVNEKINL